MKYSVLRSFFLILLIGVSGFILYGCSGPASDTPAAPPALQSSSSSPTEGYKDLFEAVKSKDTERIKAQMTKKTRTLAEMTAAKYKQPVENVYANGFTSSVFADTLPEIRDERIKDNMGAVEVWNSKTNLWEDLPFLYEDGGWKLAYGDWMARQWESPGKSKSTLERESSNTATGHPAVNSQLPGMMPGGPAANANSNVNVSSANVNTANANTPSVNK